MASPTPLSLDTGLETGLRLSFTHMQPGSAMEFASVAANRLTEFGDLQSIIVRRFDKLALQNILYLHARLASIDRLGGFIPEPPRATGPAQQHDESRALLAEYRMP